MEVKARSSVEAVKSAQKELGSRFLRVWVLTVTVLLVGGVVIAAPNWRTIVVIALAFGAYHVQQGKLWVMQGPRAGFVGSVVAARTLFIMDSEGRTRAWLGVENQYGDEEGPRLVLYNEKGQARLALRLVRENIEQGLYTEGKHAEVVPSQAGDDKPELKEPALVMFDIDGKINLCIWSNQDTPALVVNGTEGYAGMQPNRVWVINRNGKPQDFQA
jgi:hypothetical protein